MTSTPCVIPNLTTIPFEAFIVTPVSDTDIHYTCPPITVLSANELLIENRVTLVVGRYNTTFSCINNYYPVSGDVVRRCVRGEWTGFNLKCEVVPYMRKELLVTLISILACVCLVPFLCCDFFWKLEERRDLRFYRNFRIHFGSRRHYPRDYCRQVRASIKVSKHQMIHNAFPDVSHATKSLLNRLIDGNMFDDGKWSDMDTDSEFH